MADQEGLQRKIRIELTPEEAQDFIRALIEDSAYRERLQSGDPLEVQEALAERDVYVPEELIPEQITLPEPDEIRETLALLDQEGEFTVTREWGLLLPAIPLRCFISWLGLGKASQR